MISMIFRHSQVEDLREAIKKSGTEAKMDQFNKIYDDLKSLDLLSDEVRYDSSFGIFIH